MKKNNITFICATIDDTDTIRSFLIDFKEKISNQSFFNVTLIIIDQNITERSVLFKNIISNILYIHSNKKGLSHNRNLGLSYTKTELYTFIDSDCRLHESYFFSLWNTLKKYKSEPKILVYGKIIDIERKKDIFKRWPKHEKNLLPYKKWLLSCSVNIIYKTEKIFFDDQFGIGSIYPSCEDLDYALRASGVAIYTPDIVIEHPFQNFSSNSTEKIYKYAKGFGALCRKHKKNHGRIFYTLSILSLLIKLMKKVEFQKLNASLKGKLNGYKEYRE